MSIYLDDEGKPSATRTVVFVFVVLTAVVIMLDVIDARFEAQDRIYDLLQIVVMTIITAMATRSTVRYWKEPVEYDDVHADGQTCIGYDTEYDDHEDEFPHEAKRRKR